MTMSEITLAVVDVDLGHNQELVKEEIVGGVNEANATKHAHSMREGG